MKNRALLLVALASVLTVTVATAQAVSIVTVPVGNPGNAADTTGYGAVAYIYNIGKYDVTNAQYAEFLTAKATSSDPLALWNSNMGSDAEGGITRSGTGPYTYSIKPGQGNEPVVDVTWYDTIRFANWLTNGQGNGDTETGSYTLLGGTPTPSNYSTISRNAGAQWVLPNENEWYKTAYYEPSLNGGSGGYWLYPTRSNTAPIWELSTAVGPNAGTNSANYRDATNGYARTGSSSYTPTQNYLTDVGAYPNSVSAYGTLDQGGDVWQYIEAFIDGSSCCLRGGSWISSPSDLASSTRSSSIPWLQYFDTGFRVASVPEPSTITLLLASGACFLAYAWRRRTA
jgi:formylglycine-generating enzyme required for sulfatase activity